MSAGSKRKTERAERPCTYMMRDCKCPFVKGIYEKSVECEAPMENAKNILVFDGKRQLKKHVAVYCTKNFHYCEVYRMVMMAKYED